MMRYGARIVIGLILGLALAVGLTLWLDAWWIGALVGGFAGPVAFLATFFIWSADRLDEGYEQVLFDRPNTVLSGIMILALVGVSFGTGALFGGPSFTPEEEAALAQMSDARTDLADRAADYEAANTAIVAGQDPGNVGAEHQTVLNLVTAVETLDVPPRFAGLHEALQDAARHLSTAFGLLSSCHEGDQGACIEARVSYADYARSIETYNASRP